MYSVELVERALRNFEAYHNLAPYSANAEQVRADPVGIEGWASWKPGEEPVSPSLMASQMTAEQTFDGADDHDRWATTSIPSKFWTTAQVSKSQV